MNQLLEGLTLSDLTFYLVAALTIVSAAGVVFSKSIVYSAFALLGTFGGVAGLYLFLAADTIAIVQIMIYVGGILVLLLFAVMMTHKIESVDVTSRSMDLHKALPPAVVLIALIGVIAKKTEWKLLKAPDDNPITAKLGDAFLGDYLLPFEVASLVLVVALVGAVVMARREVKGDFSRKAEKESE
ncbi:MAG: NADH-quinone oxidoreductase subunit J [Deltaproteobacteria bacterium]|nr:NADH-quinone oxidoreductase subunit J [Deltaproteobacteria bacterium]